MAAPWQTATVTAIAPETPTAKTISLRPATPLGHRPGQHVVVRLTAPDGYNASRSYSVGSAPDGGHEIDLTVERLAEGEVSTFLHDELGVGDTLEVRGPIGGVAMEYERDAVYPSGAVSRTTTCWPGRCPRGVAGRSVMVLAVAVSRSIAMTTAACHADATGQSPW